MELHAESLTLDDLSLVHIIRYLITDSEILVVITVLLLLSYYDSSLWDYNANLFKNEATLRFL